MLVLLSALAFGTGPLLAKLAYRDDLDWATVVAWRFVVGAVAAWLLLFPGIVRVRPTFSRGQLAALGAVGVFYFVNVAAFYAALELIPASTAVLIAYLYPALVAVLSMRSARRLNGREAWGALGLSLVGASLTVGGAPALTNVSGVLLALAAVVLYSFYLLIADRLLVLFHNGAPERTAHLATLILTGTAVASVITALATDRGAELVAPGAAWPILIGLGVISTALAMRLLFAGINRVGAPQAALISTVEPVWTVAAAALLLSETLTLLQLVGGTLVIGSVFFSQRRVLRSPPSAPLA